MKRLSEGVLFAGILMIISFAGSTVPAIAQIPAAVIELKPTRFPFQPNEYYIRQVVDNRQGKEPIGTIIQSLSTPQDRLQVIMKGGVQSAINEFITKGLALNSDLRPINLNLHELKITEELQPDGLIRGRVQLSISFEILKNDESVKLIEYKGGSRYSRSVNQHPVLESIISKTLINALQYFDTWMNSEALVNEKLAKKVEIIFKDFEKETQKDTLYYSLNRPLGWSDFKSRPDAQSRFAAEIFPFVSFEESADVVNSEIRVELKMKVYLVRSFSWVKDYARNAYTLNHEQRHFDMVKIAAERFKKKIRNSDLTVDNYQGILSVEYLESLREMNLLQVQYDTETKHGTDQAAQQRWNRRIDDEISSFYIMQRKSF